MARATSKAELIQSADEQFTQLMALINAMSEQAKHSVFNFGQDFINKQQQAHWTRDQNLRDVLIHLYEWHKLLLNWVDANLNGEPKPFIPAPYNWKTYGQMNNAFCANHQNTPYQQAESMLENSHCEVMALINCLSDDELFTKKHFSWTGSTTLGSYFVSTTASHYVWAVKKINMHIKTYQPSQ